MQVTKRDGSMEEMTFDKIQQRLKKLGQKMDEDSGKLDYPQLVIKVIEQLCDKISTTKIDELAAEQCIALSTLDPAYGSLAGRIVVSNNQKNTSPSFSDTMEKLYHFQDVHQTHRPLISKEFWDFVQAHRTELDGYIVSNRDYLIDYFGFKTLERSYLFRGSHGMVVERPQYMWMRVAVGIHGDLSNPVLSLELIRETYDLMSLKYFTHATPTLFNAGTPHPQLSSCYLLAMEDDSIEGIFNTLKDTAYISKWAGGIGLHVHNIRAKGSHIHGTNGTSNGLVPMLRVFNNTARYIDQGGNKRPGSIAVYLEPWHADVLDFLECRKNHGDEETKARDLFYALWVPDLLMHRIKEKNGKWSLFCPHECPGLADVVGEDFQRLYEKYESEGRARKVMNARDLWFRIMDAQMETGTPYLLYKDACNRKSNQQNVGTIKSSNLCCEIVQYSDSKETAVCNLASIALPAFVSKDKQFDFNRLHQITKVVTNNLNRVIDINFYPTEKTKRSNQRHRPVGIGVQGLADAFILMDISYHSMEARELNQAIFETMYHASLEKSNELAKERGKQLRFLFQDVEEGGEEGEEDVVVEKPLVGDYAFIRHCLKAKCPDLIGAYSSFIGSPASKGLLQFDLWGTTPSKTSFDWTALKASIRRYGLRNSLLIAPMPTASTSQILGYNECFEPLTSNIYSRKTLAGEFVVVNKYLMRELRDMGHWNVQIKNNIIANKGSVQQLTMLPEAVRNKYKMVWEIPMKHLIDMAADRGPFICQSQSLNLWMEDPVYNKLTSMHFYAWEKGLKTGIYYLRRKAKHHAQQFTIQPEEKEGEGGEGGEGGEEEETICEMCSA